MPDENETPERNYRPTLPPKCGPDASFIPHTEGSLVYDILSRSGHTITRRYVMLGMEVTRINSNFSLLSLWDNKYSTVPDDPEDTAQDPPGWTCHYCHSYFPDGLSSKCTSCGSAREEE